MYHKVSFILFCGHPFLWIKNKSVLLGFYFVSFLFGCPFQQMRKCSSLSWGEDDIHVVIIVTRRERGNIVDGYVEIQLVAKYTYE